MDPEQERALKAVLRDAFPEAYKKALPIAVQLAEQNFDLTLKLIAALKEGAGQRNSTPAWSSKAKTAMKRDDLIIEILLDKNWDDPKKRGMKRRVAHAWRQRHPDNPISERNMAQILKTLGSIRDVFWAREDILNETRWDLKAEATREQLKAKIHKRHPEITKRIIGAVLTRLERGDEVVDDTIRSDEA
jgi:hypothetical protein